MNTHLMIAALLCLPLAATAQTLSTAMQHAWERAGLEQVALAGQQQAGAARAVADAWFAGAPSLAIAQRDDRFNRDRGQRERELELALPLWWPGQRDAAQAVAALGAGQAEATLAERRLALAGEVRERAWRVAASGAEAEWRSVQLRAAEKNEQDVARRVTAGDMARSDLLLAGAELASARAAHLAASNRAQQALQAWRTLAGVDALPEWPVEPAATEPGPHPQLSAADIAVTRARAELDLARATGPTAELSLGWQQSRENASAAANNSLRVGLRLPLAGETRAAPRIAAASLALVRAEADRQRLAHEISGRIAEARLALEAARQALQMAEVRGIATAERRRLLQRAFDLGELGLTELLRAQALDNEAQWQLRLAKIELGQSQSTLNQAQGVLP